MPNILHRVELEASPNDTYRALTTQEGLGGWWTTDTRGACGVGDVIQFRFGTRGRIDVKVLDLDPARRVLWQVIQGPAEWIGTQLSFEIGQDDRATSVLFEHRGWKEPSEFMHHCSTKWALFLMSMKSLVETGQGAPYPDDVHVSCGGD